MEDKTLDFDNPQEVIKELAKLMLHAFIERHVISDESLEKAAKVEQAVRDILIISEEELEEAKIEAKKEAINRALHDPALIKAVTPPIRAAAEVAFSFFRDRERTQL